MNQIGLKAYDAPPETEEIQYPICPCCGYRTDRFARNIGGEIIGCSECVTFVDAWDVDLEAEGIR